MASLMPASTLVSCLCGTKIAAAFRLDTACAGRAMWPVPQLPSVGCTLNAGFPCSRAEEELADWKVYAENVRQHMGQRLGMPLVQEVRLPIGQLSTQWPWDRAAEERGFEGCEGAFVLPAAVCRAT